MNKILLFSLFIFSIASCNNSDRENITNENTTNENVKQYDIEVSAQELYSAFSSDNDLASDKYNYKKVKITGIIDDNLKKRRSRWYINLKVKQRFGFVMCHFSDDFNNENWGFSRKDEITLICECDSYKSMVKLSDCRVFVE